MIYLLCTFDFMIIFIENYSLENALDLGIFNCKDAPGDNPPENTSNPNPDQSNSEGKPKKPKPSLQIKVGPTTDLEKDTLKVGACEHEKMSTFVGSKDSEDILCDFSSKFGSDGKVEYHKAFDSAGDIALLCDQCHAVQCMGCSQDYSSSENTSPNQ